MRKRLAALLVCMVWVAMAHAQMYIVTEAQLTASDGKHTPLWLHANKYGLSSLETTNGYMRAAVVRPQEADSSRQWKRAFGVDMAVATGFTSTFVIQQLYAELGWKKGLLSIGAKEQPMEQKNQELSSGSQTFGINARPVPGVRLELKDYWTVPGTKNLLALRGHLFYGCSTDDSWQKDFTRRETRYTEHTMLHTKAGYLRIGKPEKPFSAELGLEMACQFGGKSYNTGNDKFPTVENEGGLKGMWHALIPNGSDPDETDYKNSEGNHLGSLMLRVGLDYPTWGIAAYADHFFEDHSQIFFFCNNGYGDDDEWNQKIHKKYFVYDLRDALVGVELQLKNVPWLNAVVAEYLYTKYQSGPIYHDHSRIMPDQIAGLDNYYNHHLFTGWQHWGQVMGNPLYRSPLYNDNHDISVSNNRFWAWHLGISGDPMPRLHYRLLATWQKGFGTYKDPFINPSDNVSMLAEASYCFAEKTPLKGWRVKCGVGVDRGSLLGDNVGVEFTVGKRFNINNKRR